MIVRNPQDAAELTLKLLVRVGFKEGLTLNILGSCLKVYSFCCFSNCENSGGIHAGFDIEVFEVGSILTEEQDGKKCMYAVGFFPKLSYRILVSNECVV